MVSRTDMQHLNSNQPRYCFLSAKTEIISTQTFSSNGPARWPRWHMISFFYLFYFLFIFFCYFRFIFSLFFFLYFVFVFILFSLCSFSLLDFSYSFLFSFFIFFFIYFRFLKWQQALETKKTTWTRADIAPKMNQYGQRLTYACTAAVCYIKRCKKSQYFTCATWKAMKHSLLFIKKHGTRHASFSGY